MSVTGVADVYAAGIVIAQPISIADDCEVPVPT